MKLFILGASGGTGSALVKQAIMRGHTVTAFVRSPEKMTQRSRQLSVVRGDPRDANQLAPALTGHGVVLSALGSRTLKPNPILGVCAKSTIEAMQRVNMHRLFVVSSALLFPHVGLLGSFLRRFVLSNAMADSREMERWVTSSNLDWTIVRPTRLTDGPKTERYQIEYDRLPRGKGLIARNDVAHFILEALENEGNLRRVVGVSQ